MDHQRDQSNYRKEQKNDLYKYIRYMSLSNKTKTLLKAIYTDPEVGFTSKRVFIQQAKAVGVKASMKKIGEFYDSLTVNQVFKKAPKPLYTKISCFYGRGCFQADLMDVSRYSGSNKGVTFLLNVIEVETKYIWSFPLKSKQPSEVAPHLATVYENFQEKMPNHVMTLQTDQGNEFKGAVNDVNKKHNVKHTRTLNKFAMGVVESLHKAFWDYFRRWSAVQGNKLNFISVLPNFVKNYNNRIHTSTKKKPIDLFTGKEPLPLYERQPGLKLKKGQFVRIKRAQNQFEKASFLPKYSDQVYELVKNEGRRWTLKNSKNGNVLQTTYLERELLKVDGPNSEDIQLEKAIVKRNKEARTKRLNKREPAFKLSEGEKERLKPERSGRRKAVAPIRFRKELDGAKFSEGEKELQPERRGRRKAVVPIRFRKELG